MNNLYAIFFKGERCFHYDEFVLINLSNKTIHHNKVYMLHILYILIIGQRKTAVAIGTTCTLHHGVEWLRTVLDCYLVSYCTNDLKSHWEGWVWNVYKENFLFYQILFSVKFQIILQQMCLIQLIWYTLIVLNHLKFQQLHLVYNNFDLNFTMHWWVSMSNVTFLI